MVPTEAVRDQAELGAPRATVWRPLQEGRPLVVYLFISQSRGRLTAAFALRCIASEGFKPLEDRETLPSALCPHCVR